MIKIIVIKLNVVHETSNSDNDLRWNAISWEIDQKGIKWKQDQEKKAL